MAEPKKPPKGLVQYKDKSWGVDYYDGPRRIRQKVGSFADAQAYYSEIKRKQRIGDVLPDKKPKVKVADLLELYLARATNKDSRRAAEEWLERMGGQPVEDITESVIRGWINGIRKRWLETTSLKAPLAADELYLLADHQLIWRSGTRLRLGKEVVKIYRVHKRGYLLEAKPRLKAYPKGFMVETEVGLSEASIYRQLAPLGAAFNLGIKKGLCKENPCADHRAIGLQRLTNQRHRTLSPREEVRLLECLGERWWPYVQFAIMTGLRFGNQFSLRWDEVDWEGRLIVPIVKGRKQMPIIITPPLRAVLEEMRTRFPLAQYVFPSPEGHRVHASNFSRRNWRPALKMADIQDFRWHDLRRTTASRLISQGYSLQVVKEVLGHEDARTTDKHYARMANEALQSAQVRLAEGMARFEKESI